MGNHVRGSTNCQTDISGRTVAVKVAVPVMTRVNRTSTAARSERGDTAFIDNQVNHVNGIVMNHSSAVERERGVVIGVQLRFWYVLR